MSAILNLLRLKPGQWMNVDTIKKEANARAKQCTERWDIPQTVTLELKGKATDVPVDADLLNKRPLLFGTRNGGRLSGYMLEEDPTTGFNSPATPLLFSILPVLAIVMASTGLLLGTVGTALGLIPFLLVAWTILDVAGAAWALGALTIGLGGVFSTISNGMGIPALLQGGASYSSIFLPILLLLPALFLFNRGLKTGLRRLAILLAAIFATMIACHFLPIPLVVLLWSLALAVLDNFLSVVLFSSSTSTKEWIRNLLGYVSKLRFMGRSGAVNFRGSWSSLAQSVYGDPDHEFAAFFRRRRRAGAGRFAGAHNDKRDGRAIHKHDGEITDFQSMNHAEWSQPEPLFTQSDEATLAQKGMAVAQVLRAGVKRHEMIEAAQMYSNGQSNDVFKRVVGAVRHPWIEAQSE